MAKTRSSSDVPVTAADMKSIIDSLKQHFDSKLKGLEIKLTSKISEVTNEINTFISDLKLRASALENRVAALERQIDILERSARSKDVLLHGIPVLPKENIRTVMDKLFKVLDLAPLTGLVAYRTAKGIKDGISDPATSVAAANKVIKSPIVIKFNNHGDKELFIRAVKRKKPKISQLDFAGDTGVFVRECLSTLNLQIFRECMKLKHIGRLSSVFSINGFVYVRCSQNMEEKPIKVISTNQLANLGQSSSGASMSS